jgi:hypothetical protein
VYNIDTLCVRLNSDMVCGQGPALSQKTSRKALKRRKVAADLLGTVTSAGFFSHSILSRVEIKVFTSILLMRGEICLT